MRSAKLLTSLSALTLFAVSASATLLVYEGFDYGNAGDDLDAISSVGTDATGLNPSTGATDSGWTDSFPNTEMFLKSGSLGFSNLQTSGNHIGYNSNSNQDVFNRALTGGVQTSINTLGTNNDTLYFSFLFEKLQNNFSADREGLALMNVVLPNARWDSGNGGANNRHGFAVAAVNGTTLQAVGYNGTTGVREVSSFSVTGTGVGGGVNLIVGEVSFNTGDDLGGGLFNDVFTLYSVTDDGELDGTDLSSLGTIQFNMDESTLNTLNITRQVNVNYDEVRFGSSLDSVIPVPEVSAFGLIGLGGLLLLRRRRS